MSDDSYPRLERSVNVEVGRPRNGRPGYAWVQGWVVKYSATRWSGPMRFREAQALLRDERKAKP